MPLVAVQRPRQRHEPFLVGEGDEVVAGGLLHQALARGHDLLADAVDREQAHRQGGDGHDGEHRGEGAPAQAEGADAALHGLSDRR